MNPVNSIIKIKEDFTIMAASHPIHVFILSGKEVAKGYEVSSDNIRKHKSENKAEFIENKHFVVRNPHNKSGSVTNIFWTLRGVLRLGFMIKSEAARTFRDWAEDTLFNTVTGNVQFRGKILSEKAKNQKRYHELEDELLEDEKYKELIKVKAAIMRSGKELKEMDTNIVNTQLDLFLK